MKRKSIILEFLVTGAIGFIVSGIVVGHIFRNIMKMDNQAIKKITRYYNILNKWLTLRQQQKTIVEFFEKNGYKTVAIYGMKELGERLVTELENTGIVVKCIIDQNTVVINKNILVLRPDDFIPDVDVVVVTASYYFSEIKKRLKGRVHGDVVSIDDVVYSKH